MNEPSKKLLAFITKELENGRTIVTISVDRYITEIEISSNTNKEYTNKIFELGKAAIEGDLGQGEDTVNGLIRDA